MDHPTVCDMMRRPPSFFLSNLHQWKAVICRIPTVLYIIYISILSMSVKVASLMISGVLNGPSSCSWYEERTTKLLGEYPTWMESCDMQDVNETSYIFVTSVHQSKWPLQWSPVHWMDHLAVCDMMRGPPSFFLSILHQWKAVICRTPTVHHIYV